MCVKNSNILLALSTTDCTLVVLCLLLYIGCIVFVILGCLFVL
jgi:hypothetical protein